MSKTKLKLTKDKMREDGPEIPTFDLQTAADLSRNYNKLIGDAYLKVRMSLWNMQYLLCLFFLFLSYICPLIDDLIDTQIDPWKKGILLDAQFWLFWTGVYYPSQQAEHGI